MLSLFITFTRRCSVPSPFTPSSPPFPPPPPSVSLSLHHPPPLLLLLAFLFMLPSLCPCNIMPVPLHLHVSPLLSPITLSEMLTASAPPNLSSSHFNLSLHFSSVPLCSWIHFVFLWFLHTRLFLVCSFISPSFFIHSPSILLSFHLPVLPFFFLFHCAFLPSPPCLLLLIPCLPSFTLFYPSMLP